MLYDVLNLFKVKSKDTRVSIGDVLVSLLLTYFIAQCSISTPLENVRKPKVFLTFSGGIEMEHWVKIG